MSRHVLVLGPGQRHKISTLQTAKRLDLTVSLMGPTLPDWATPFIDRFLPTAPLDDQAAAVRVAQDLHRDSPLDAVVTFWDRDVEVVAHIAEALGLPGCPVAAAERVRSKYAMRVCLDEAGLPQPRFGSFTTWDELLELSSELGLPLVCKPWGSGGSKGIFKISEVDRLYPTFREMVRHVVPEADPMFRFHPGRFVAEECINGQEVSIEGVVARGVVHLAGVTEKWTQASTCQEWQHAFPARLDPAVTAEVRELTRTAVASLGLDNCAFHAEIMITDQGCRIIEVNGRIGGDLIHTHLVPLGCGADIIEAAYRAAVGDEVALTRRWSQGACVRFLLADRAGVVKQWQGIDEATASAGVVEFAVEKDVGDTVALPPVKFLDERLCYVVTAAKSTGLAIECAQRALDYVRCDLT